MTRPKILALYDKNGCCFWRTWQPLKAMQEAGLAEVRFIELKVTPKKDLGKHLAWCDIVHSLGMKDTNGLLAMRQWQNSGLKVVMDYDDLHFNVSPFNTAYRNYGLEDVQVRDPKTGDTKFLWKDGLNGFDVHENKVKFHAYKEVLKEAELVTTTTLYLQSAMKEIQPEANIRVLPNAIDLTQWKPMDVREKYADKFRFGWAVSGSHGEDWLYIREALVKFLSAHKDAKFVCMGDTYMDIRKGLPEGQVEWHPFSDLWEGHYALRMPLLGLDCAIAPLADLEFNKCKSPLKFEEYTAFGWPVIAQKMLPYTECIVHGETGLLADSTDGWVHCLEVMMNEKRRKEIHFNAMFTIKALFDLKQIVQDYHTVYTDLLNGVTNDRT